MGFGVLTIFRFVSFFLVVVAFGALLFPLFPLANILFHNLISFLLFFFSSFLCFL